MQTFNVAKNKDNVFEHINRNINQWILFMVLFIFGLVNKKQTYAYGKFRTKK